MKRGNRPGETPKIESSKTFEGSLPVKLLYVGYADGENTALGTQRKKKELSPLIQDRV